MPKLTLKEEALVDGIYLNWRGYFVACKIINEAEFKAANKSLRDVVAIRKTYEKALHYVLLFRRTFSHLLHINEDPVKKKGESGIGMSPESSEKE